MVYKTIKKGDWIFTCKLIPLRFSHIITKDLSDYGDSWKEKSQEERDRFIHDDFVTMEGSHHSMKHCGCEIISDEYAKWFIENEIHLLYKDSFEDYEKLVKEKCKEANITYEGI